MPDLDSFDSIDDIETTNTFTTVNGVQYGTFSATFDRLLNTGQADDFIFRMNSQIDAIYAHGPILSNMIQAHDQNTRGSFLMLIPSFLNSALTLGKNSLLALLAVSSGVILFAF
jgi:hypothetical protein